MGLEQLHLLRLPRVGAVEVSAQHRVEHQLHRLLRAPVKVHRFLRSSFRLLLELLRRRGSTEPFHERLLRARDAVLLAFFHQSLLDLQPGGLEVLRRARRRGREGNDSHAQRDEAGAHFFAPRRIGEDRHGILGEGHLLGHLLEWFELGHLDRARAHDRLEHGTLELLRA